MVDRVLHGRDHLRQVTRDRVDAALAELDRKHAATGWRGRTFTLDILIQSPVRFSQAVRVAFEAELPLMRPAAFGARLNLAEIMEEREIVARLRAIVRRGTQGIVLKVPATLAIEACLEGLARARLPVVTYVTDVAAPLRLAYVGMENAHAGATAAHLLSRMAGPAPSRVPATPSIQMFRGEDLRRKGFVDHIARDAPHLVTVTVSEGFGEDRAPGAIVRQALEAHPDIRSVYCNGGGDAAIVEASTQAGRRIEVFAAHDLDGTNRALLHRGQVSFVIHHDFRQDARRVSLHIAKHHRMIGQGIEIDETDIQIACPILLTYTAPRPGCFPGSGMQPPHGQGWPNRRCDRTRPRVRRRG